MEVGTALSATFASKGFLVIMNLTFMPPSSLKISLPKNSASLLAQVIDVPFYVPYSFRLFESTLSSPMYSIRSISSL